MLLKYINAGVKKKVFQELDTVYGSTSSTIDFTNRQSTWVIAVQVTFFGLKGPEEAGKICLAQILTVECRLDIIG